jgi:CRISPR-associated protein Cas8a1/Csx13
MEGRAMAKAVKARAGAEVPALLISLHAPGMTPLLKAGAGGLAASLRSLLRRQAPQAAWSSPVPVGPGSATVEPTAIRLSWGGQPPEETLKALFHESFRIREPEGLMDLPGTYEPERPPRLEVAVALQEALKLTFLQHGQTTTKEGAAQVRSLSVDERELRLAFQPYSGFVHQKAWSEVARALSRGSTSLAGWAYPGAAERHIGLRVTKMEYTAAEALCACFALVGCLSYKAALVRGGALVAFAPSDLVRFAELRPRLTPRKVEEVSVTGISDAVLCVELALRMEGALGARALDTAEAFSLKVVPWARQQKSRGGVLREGHFPERVLTLYHEAVSHWPHRLTVLALPDAKGKQGKKAQEPSAGNFFVAASALRGFVSDNLAEGRPWYAGFATATVTSGAKRRSLHTFRTRDNLGALFLHERKGLIAMLQHLEEAEQALVESVHVALRQRFGAIAEENPANPTARKNRMNAERDRWRLAFAGAKTQDQVRGALADLWSRAGPNRALQARWKDILPLLREQHWRAARDLALVALASYQGKGAETAETAAGDEAPPFENE